MQETFMAEPLKSEILPDLNPVPSRSESLVLRAEGMLKGEAEDKLPSADRQDALLYLMSVRPDLSNIELGRLFKVNEKTIRNDKEAIRKRLSDEMGDKDIGLVISDLVRGHERLMTELAKSTAKCEYGTNTKLAHLKFEQEANFKIVEVLQSLGVYPKNLGSLTKTEFIFKAHVAKGGGVNTVPVTTRSELKTIEAAEYKQLPGAYETDEDKALRAELEAQFSDAKEVPTSGPARSS
jgi:hypothetical protein